MLCRSGISVGQGAVAGIEQQERVQSRPWDRLLRVTTVSTVWVPCNGVRSPPHNSV